MCGFIFEIKTNKNKIKYKKVTHFVCVIGRFIVCLKTEKNSTEKNKKSKKKWYKENAERNLSDFRTQIKSRMGIK